MSLGSEVNGDHRNDMSTTAENTTTAHDAKPPNIDSPEPWEVLGDFTATTRHS